MKRVYLVDCENVGFSNFDNIDISKDTQVYYFTSNNTHVAKLESYEFEVHVEHNHEKDALDFIIHTKLGSLIQEYGKDAGYQIVSKDKGFDVVVDFLTKLGYVIIRSGCPVANFGREILLRNDYGRVVATLTDEQQRKLNNIRTHWNRYCYRDLYEQLYRTFWRLKPDDFILLCDYIYYSDCIDYTWGR